MTVGQRGGLRQRVKFRFGVVSVVSDVAFWRISTIRRSVSRFQAFSTVHRSRLEVVLGVVLGMSNGQNLLYHSQTVAILIENIFHVVTQRIRYIAHQSSGPAVFLEDD